MIYCVKGPWTCNQAVDRLNPGCSRFGNLTDTVLQISAYWESHKKSWKYNAPVQVHLQWTTIALALLMYLIKQLDQLVKSRMPTVLLVPYLQ